MVWSRLLSSGSTHSAWQSSGIPSGSPIRKPRATCSGALCRLRTRGQSMMSVDGGAHRPIGVFDSGVGGLSILRAMRQLMPQEDALYFGDQGHIPYGPRSADQIRDFSAAITRFLVERGAKLIVVACNAASAAALKFLRASFSQVD